MVLEFLERGLACLGSYFVVGISRYSSAPAGTSWHSEAQAPESRDPKHRLKRGEITSSVDLVG